MDFELKRARINDIDRCDAGAFFRYHAIQGCGYRIDDPEEVESALFEKAQGLNENAVADLIRKSASSSPFSQDLSIMLLMISCLASAERFGGSWNFEKIVQALNVPPNGPLYQAIFSCKIPFRQIRAALHFAAFLHLFVQPDESSPFRACLTENCRKPAIQLQFKSGHTVLFPLEISSSLPLVQNPALKPLFDAFLPKSNYVKNEAIAPMQKILETAHSLKERAPYLALQFFLLAGSMESQESLDLFFSLLIEKKAGQREIAELENALANKKITPRWHLEKVATEEDAIFALAESGVFCQFAFQKWKKRKDLSFGIRLLKEIHKADKSLAENEKRAFEGEADQTART